MSISGAAFQGLFRNPLVSPHILGVSAGAGFGAAIAILFFGNMAAIQMLSFACALLAVFLTYGLSRVLFGISLEIAPGECVSLLGRNGVGKTTTMRSIMGLTPPSSGRVLWRGRDITGWAPHRVARTGIGFVPEERRIFAELSVWENLEVGARAARRPGYWTIATVGELFPVLRERRGQRGGFLSGGEQQMLTIARTLMGNPELLLLDEPSEGLAPLVVDALLAKIGELKAQGLTILLAEQGVTRVPVVERDRPDSLLGLVTLVDLLSGRLIDLQEEREAERVLRIRFWEVARGRRRRRPAPTAEAGPSSSRPRFRSAASHPSPDRASQTARRASV